MVNDRVTPKALLLAFCLIGSMLGGIQPSVGADADGPTEYDVKAAFLYNFTLFANWPPAALENRKTFVIGILGTDPFGSSLDQIVTGKVAHEKPLVIRRFSRLDEARDSQVLYISPSESGDLESILASLANAPILTVGDGRLFLSKGGMISFNVQQDHVRFSVNLAAADKAGLQLSSQLLKVAKSVKGENP